MATIQGNFGSGRSVVSARSGSSRGRGFASGRAPLGLGGGSCRGSWGEFSGGGGLRGGTLRRGVEIHRRSLHAVGISREPESGPPCLCLPLCRPPLLARSRALILARWMMWALLPLLISYGSAIVLRSPFCILPPPRVRLLSWWRAPFRGAISASMIP